MILLRSLSAAFGLGLVAAGAGSSFQGSYKVGKQDVIRIEVPEDVVFTGEATVSDKGTISYNILGELQVEGLTASEIAELIRKELINRKLLTQPTVTVVVKTYRSQSTTVLGEVRTPGKYYLQGPDRLIDVIAAAGGLTSVAGDITIHRTTPKGPEIITVDATKLLSDTTPLQSGDVILVRPKEISQVFVSGEVVAGKPLTHTSGLTVSQAILMAGGLNRFGSKSKITIRRSTDGKEELIRVNLADIEKGKTKDVPLMPNDHVIVGRRIF